jgi:hypothetical protein
VLRRFREDDDHGPCLEESDPDPAILTIILARSSLATRTGVERDSMSISEVQTVLLNVGLVLLLVPDEVHPKSLASAILPEAAAVGYRYQLLEWPAACCR